MALIVQKFGGTSIADVERIRDVAGRAVAAQRAVGLLHGAFGLDAPRR